MPDAAEKLLGLLTMCRRAGRLTLGFDAVKDAAAAGHVHCILLAADASPKTAKEIRYYAGRVPVRILPADMETLRHFFRKKTAVFGVCDSGFAGKLLNLLPEDADAPAGADRRTEM